MPWNQRQLVHDNLHDPLPAKPDFAPTPQNVVDRMVNLLRLDEDSVFVDLGCGDGRVVVAVAKKYGCKSVGIDSDRNRINQSRRLALDEGIAHLCSFVESDVRNVDLTKVDAVYVYLEQETLKDLVPRFKAMRPEALLISYLHKVDVPGAILQHNEDGIFVWNRYSKPMAAANDLLGTPLGGNQNDLLGNRSWSNQNDILGDHDGFRN